MTPEKRGKYNLFHGNVIVTTRIVNSKSLRKICRQILSTMNVLNCIELELNACWEPKWQRANFNRIPRVVQLRKIVFLPTDVDAREFCRCDEWRSITKPSVGIQCTGGFANMSEGKS